MSAQQTAPVAGALRGVLRSAREEGCRRSEGLDGLLVSEMRRRMIGR